MLEFPIKTYPLHYVVMLPILPHSNLCLENSMNKLFTIINLYFQSFPKKGGKLWLVMIDLIGDDDLV